MASSREGHNAGDKTGKNYEIFDLYCFKGNSQWKKTKKLCYYLGARKKTKSASLAKATKIWI